VVHSHKKAHQNDTEGGYYPYRNNVAEKMRHDTRIDARYTGVNVREVR
jgi:hypothetical protein